MGQGSLGGERVSSEVVCVCTSHCPPTQMMLTLGEDHSIETMTTWKSLDYYWLKLQ